MEHYKEICKLIPLGIAVAIGTYYFWKRKRYRAMMAQASRDLGGTFHTGSRQPDMIEFSVSNGGTCRAFIDYGSHGRQFLYLQIEHAPQFVFNFVKRDSIWVRPYGEKLSLGPDIDRFGKFRTDDANNASDYFDQYDRRIGLISLAQAGFRTISCDGNVIQAEKENFNRHDLIPQRLADYANTLCALAY